jgi:hypothetical protein
LRRRSNSASLQPKHFLIPENIFTPFAQAQEMIDGCFILDLKSRGILPPRTVALITSSWLSEGDV